MDGWVRVCGEVEVEEGGKEVRMWEGVCVVGGKCF